MPTVPNEPLPSVDAMRDGLAALREKARSAVRPNALDARDPAFIARILPLMGVFYDHYFRCETEILGELPPGRFLAVGNHNGMTGTPDMFCHMVAYWRTALPARLAYGLMHDVPFRVPWAGSWLGAAGAIAASRQNAQRALDRDAAVLVFPGGDLDSCKPFSKRYTIEFGSRRGFVRTAIREQVPIVPIVSVGAHESLYIYSDGRKIADALHLPELVRSNVAPLGFALPWGLIVGIPFPHIAPPVKIHTRFLAPIEFDMPRSAADDPAQVERAFARVVAPMQEALDEMRELGRHGLFPSRRDAD